MRDPSQNPAEVARSLGVISVDCEHPESPAIEFVDCENCKVRYAIHCNDCKSQITGCRCTLTRRIKEAEEDAAKYLHG